MNGRRFLVLLVISTIIALTPLAHASPPDQTWIAGLYDNADYDDIVLSITTALGVVESCMDRESGPIRPVVAVLPQIDERPRLVPELSSNLTRAPPAA